MELRRTLIIVALAVVSYFLILAWQRDYGPKPVAAVAQSSSTAANAAPAATPGTDLPAANTTIANGDVPAAPQKADIPGLPSAPAAASSSLIQVQTDVLKLTIDPVGGDIVELSLPQYTKSVDSKEAFVLLQNNFAHSYIAQSGLIGSNGPDSNPAGRPRYSSSAASYQLNGDSLEVVLSLPAQDGVTVQKVFSFKRGDYTVQVSYRIANQGEKPWHGLMYGQLKRDNAKDPSSENHSFGMITFLGGAWWSPEKSYNKLALDDFADEPVKETVKGGWAAMVQHYFVSAWVPAKDSQNSFSTRSSGGFNYIGFVGQDLAVAPGQKGEVSAQFYAGPKIQDKLKALSEGLELTVDYGWLWFIAQFLFWLLKLIHGWVGNWGWAIVLLTVLVKAAFFQLSAKSYKSMANMRRVMPEMQRIKEQFGADRQKMSQAMMDLYRKEKINPLGGCLPILVQMPVFIALYWTLMESVELRHAPWILWIKDLSLMDKYFVLPILMGITMWIQQHLNPAPPDPMQAKIMKLMPIVFTFMFLWFPAGLVLYWLVNNMLSIAQQWVITRQIEKAAGGKA